MIIFQIVCDYIFYVRSNCIRVNRNRANQTAHVKTSLVHTLHRIQKYGSYDLNYYQPLLTEEQFQACKGKGPKSPWYPLTQDLMVYILHIQCKSL